MTATKEELKEIVTKFKEFLRIGLDDSIVTKVKSDYVTSSKILLTLDLSKTFSGYNLRLVYTNNDSANQLVMEFNKGVELLLKRTITYGDLISHEDKKLYTSKVFDKSQELADYILSYCKDEITKLPEEFP